MATLRRLEIFSGVICDLVVVTMNTVNYIFVVKNAGVLESPMRNFYIAILFWTNGCVSSSILG
jgi:hypothetical protein